MNDDPFDKFSKLKDTDNSEVERARKDEQQAKLANLDTYKNQYLLNKPGGVN
jgi:hypothetical protein